MNDVIKLALQEIRCEPSGKTTQRIRFALDRLLNCEDYQVLYLWPGMQTRDYPLRIAITILQQNPSRDFFQVDMKAGRLFLPNGRSFRVMDGTIERADAASFYNATVMFDHAFAERFDHMPARCWLPFARRAADLAQREGECAA